jgi:rhodanese-related sulfurtransferase
MTADELAFRMLDSDPHLVLVDIRREGAQKALALPGSVSIPMDGLFGKEWGPLLGRRHTTRVFVDEDGSRGLQAALLAETLGYDNVRVLHGGMAEFRATILDFEPTHPASDAEEADAYRFRSEARVLLAKQIADARSQTPRPAKIVKKVQGGCS